MIDHLQIIIYKICHRRALASGLKHFIFLTLMLLNVWITDLSPPSSSCIIFAVYFSSFPVCWVGWTLSDRCLPRLSSGTWLIRVLVLITYLDKNIFWLPRNSGLMFLRECAFYWLGHLQNPLLGLHNAFLTCDYDSTISD